MPFTMIHLHVAMRAAGSKTEKKEEFLLGSIAPDAVHYLPDYTSSYKCRSHLLPDGIPWGTCKGRNNELWEENIRKFVIQWAGVVEKDFILGYAVHLLTDLFNNVHMWTPLRSRAGGYQPGDGKCISQGIGADEYVFDLSDDGAGWNPGSAGKGGASFHSGNYRYFGDCKNEAARFGVYV